MALLSQEARSLFVFKNGSWRRRVRKTKTLAVRQHHQGERPDHGDQVMKTAHQARRKPAKNTALIQQQTPQVSPAEFSAQMERRRCEMARPIDLDRPGHLAP